MYYTGLMADDEKWLPVPGYPDYEVSDQGRVRSLDREVSSPHWKRTKTVKGRLLKQSKVGGSKPGGRYYGCVLYRDRRRRPVMVHSLVLEAFVGPRPEGMNGCHRDDNPENNRLDNLYWGTQQQNVQDAIGSGRHACVATAARTHCDSGHEYTPENTYIRPRGHRECRKCHNAQVKAAWHRRKGQSNPAA